MTNDFRYAIRTLGRTPAFSLIAIATIALGIAANTAIFSIVNAVLLQPLPFRDESALVTVATTTAEEPEGGHSAAEFLDLQSGNQSLAGVAGYREDLATVATAGGSTVQLESSYVTANFFDVLGTPAEEGRAFSAVRDAGSRERLVVLSHAAAQTLAGSGRVTIGAPMRINGQTYLLAGVMPAAFHWPETSKVWLLAHGPVPPSPFDLGDTQDPLQDRDVRYFSAIARLKPGVTLAAAQADLDALASRLPEGRATGSERRTFRLRPLRDDLVGDVRQALLVIQAAVGLVLLIACANVSSLLIARATGRRRELAIRAAVGASRGDLLRQLLVESVLLGLAGGAIGLLGGSWLITALTGILPAGVPRVDAIDLDRTVALVTLAASLGTGILFGILPALQASRADASSAMKEGGLRGSTRNRGRAALVIAEVAVTLVLLVAAGLLGTSFVRLQNVSSGFNPDRAVVASLSVPQARYPKAEDQVRIYRQLVDRLAERPGIEAVAVGFPGPLHGSSARGSFDVEGRSSAGGRPSANLAAISGGYFNSLGVPLIAGRTFAATDTADSAPVAIVNNALAQKYWPGENPVGKHLRFDEDAKEPWITIVGLVGDTRQLGLSQAPPPLLYLPYTVLTLPFTTVSVRSSLPTSDVTSIMRAELAAVDPDLGFTEVETLPQLFTRYLGEPRFRALALGTFATLALLLAAVGLYGLISFSVAQRTREIGIRMALGASPRQILGSIVREGLVLTAAGIAAGLVGAVAAGRLLRSFLFGVGAADPLTFAAVATLLVFVAVAASYIPSRRALRVDPLVALRAE
jgi:putative ABC transport system permease protein